MITGSEAQVTREVDTGNTGNLSNMSCIVLMETDQEGRHTGAEMLHNQLLAWARPKSLVHPPAIYLRQ